MFNVFLSYVEAEGFDMAVEKIRKKISGDDTHSVYFMVPEQFSAEAERMLNRALNRKGLINIGVYSISSLTRLIIQKAGLKTAAVIDDCGRSMILNVIMERLKTSLRCFSSMSGKTSFNESLSELIQEFRKSNVTSAELEEKMTDENSSPYLRKKLSDLLGIYSAYEGYLEGDYIDREQLPLSAAAFIEEGNMFENSSFYYFGYDGFDETDYALISAIASRGIEQNFIFITDTTGASPSDAYAVVENTIEEVKNLAAELSQDILIKKNTDTSMLKEDICFLAENLFSTGTEKYAGEPENIVLSRTDTVYEEVERAASMIRDLVRKEEISYSDIQVLPSDFNAYRDVISEVFTRYNITYFLDNTTELVTTNILRAIVKILDIIADNFRTPDVIALMKTGVTDIGRKDAEIFENYCNEFDIRGSMWTRDFTYNRDDAYDLVHMNAARAQLMQPIVKLKNRVEKKTRASEITEEFFRFLMEYRIDEFTRKSIERFTEEEDYTNANRYAQIYDNLITTLEQIHDFIGEEEMTLSEYTKTLKMGFSSLKIGIIPSTIDAVNIATVSRSRNRATRYLFLLGLNDGKLPSSFSSSGSVLSDSEKTELTESGMKLRSTDEMKASQERYFITNLILKTYSKIFMSWPLTDLKGAELSPSSIVMRTLDIFPDLREKTYSASDAEDAMMLVNTVDSTFRHLIDNEMNPSSDPDTNAIWEAVKKVYSESEKGREYTKLLESALNFSNKAELKEKKLVKELYDGGLFASITKLQTYANCPFRYFVSYMLRPEEFQKNTLSSPDLGTIFHRIIERYSRMIIDGKVDAASVSADEINALADSLSDSVMSDFASGKVNLLYNSEFFRRKIHIGARNALSNMTKEIRNGSFSISSTEKPFGRKKDRTIPMTLTTKKGNSVTLNGIIDRVDRYEDADGNYVKVIDYKTKQNSYSTFDLKESYYGTKIQLPVYLMAEMKEEKDSMAAGALYFRILPDIEAAGDSDSLAAIKEKEKSSLPNGFVIKNDDIIKKMSKTGYDDKEVKKYDEEDMTLLIKRTRNVIREMTDGITAGNIEIKPFSDSCDYCPYSAICSFDTSFSENSHRKKDLSKKDIFDAIREEVAENEVD